ncbi:hypothetical protein CkaCkLH20_11415 [Colletotrichum karsti]|uniref:Uncharacterized protein n=1 Tax=Colletotrichum karsti TaxID=1095194 RepID=A0A9P6HTT9_9PEZI|nr:uncharacterized protein CkaCkLH20_11415 [Colletotrichum karsti]KAF9870998.1 hypothetical protein CkaCkLH20_11415 [Colletotrichum karsti]
MAGSVYPVTSQTELVSSSNVSRRKPATNAPIWYFVYNSLIIALVISAITFWFRATQSPLLYSFEFGQWLLDHPKTGTIIWTACGTVAAAVLVVLLKSVLFLMVRQSSRVGATLSTIEVWNKCANQQPLLDVKRPWLSGFTAINWFVALTLTTAFTTLITPTRVLVSESLLGNELDFTSPEFWTWYNTWNATTGRPVRKVFGCTRYTYTSPTGSLTFPTCPIANDPVACISAGVAAAQESFGARNASVRVIDSLFKGSTGGVLPLGFGGIPAFNNVKFGTWDQSTEYPQYNYSLTQQGLSADISCHETPDTPIQTDVLQTMNVTNSAAGGKMQLVNFFIENDYCYSSQTWVVPLLGIVAPALCQPNKKVKKYEFYLAPFRQYSHLPNMTCSIEPVITKNLVSYSTSTGLFASTIMERMGSSSVPNETADAVSALFMISITSWGSGLIESLLSLNTTGDGSGNFSYPAAVEAALRGIVEYEGTNLRIYYSANEAAGRSTVNGTYNVLRVGYHQTQPTALLILLPLLLYVVIVAWSYTWVGLRTGLHIEDGFNPTDSTSLVTAAAAGAESGKLGFEGMSSGNHKVQEEIMFKLVHSLSQRINDPVTALVYRLGSRTDGSKGAGPVSDEISDKNP